MYTTYLKLAGSLALCALLGCSAENAEERPEPPPVEETVFDDMVGTMDRARSVEDTTMQHKQDLDRALQESEGQ